MGQVHSYWKYFELFFFLQLEKEELLGAETKPLDLTVLRFESRVLEQVLGFREFYQGHSSKSIEV